MTTLARAFIEMASYLKIAKFDDPDEAQGAEEIVGLFLIQASSEERALLSQIARERAKEEAAQGASAELVQFYEEFAANADYYEKYPEI